MTLLEKLALLEVSELISEGDLVTLREVRNRWHSVALDFCELPYGVPSAQLTLGGSMLPFLIKRCGLDPATSLAPFVATLVDVTGLAIFFSVALVVLHGTLL